MKKILILSFILVSLVGTMLPMKRRTVPKAGLVPKAKAKTSFSEKEFKRHLKDKNYDLLGSFFASYTEKLFEKPVILQRDLQDWTNKYCSLVDCLQEPAALGNIEAALALMKVYGGSMHRSIKQEESATSEGCDRLQHAQESWIRMFDELPRKEQESMKKDYEEVRLGLVHSYYMAGDFGKAIDEGKAFLARDNFEAAHKDSICQEAHFIVGASYFVFQNYTAAFEHFFKIYRRDLNIPDDLNHSIMHLLGNSDDSEDLLNIHDGIKKAQGAGYLRAFWLLTVQTFMQDKFPDDFFCKRYITSNKRELALATARFERKRQCFYMEHDPELIEDNKKLDG